MENNEEIILGDIVVDEEIEIGDIEMDVEKIYPPLEDLEVTPSGEEQVFTPKVYGFGKVYVKKVESEELTVTPSAEEQVKEGLFKKVTVAGDSNLIPENIAEGKSIFGIEGKAEVQDEELIASYLSMIDGTLGANVTKLPSVLTEIGDNAFHSKSNLMLNELPDGLIRIGKRAFYSCSKLALTKLPDSLTIIDDYAFDGCSILALQELPSGLTEIGTYGFGSCSKLALTKLPDGLTIIDDYAFYNCKLLKIKELPANITTIKSQSFRNCSALEEITCQGAITNIESFAFYSDSNLKKFAIPNITSIPTLVNVGAFESTGIAKGNGYIYFPDNLVEEAKIATNWSTYAEQIKPISEMEG